MTRIFRELRKKKQLLSNDKITEILTMSTSGVLGINGDNGYPYTVPMSHFYKDGFIYLHSIKTGYKIDDKKRFKGFLYNH